MTFHLMCVHIILVQFWLLSGHLLGNSCSFGKTYILREINLAISDKAGCISDLFTEWKII